MRLQAQNNPIDHGEPGASMIEYALLAALIAVVCVISLTFLGGTASTTFSKVGSGFQGNN